MESKAAIDFIATNHAQTDWLTTRREKQNDKQKSNSLT
jgi:hypothetical protein